MIPRRILLTVLTILLLMSTFAYSKSDSTGTRNDTVAIEVLEERVKGNAEKTKNQVEALQKLLEAQNKAINQRITDLDEASHRRTNNILWMAGFFLTLSIAVVTFFGHRAITGWIKQSISKRTEKLIKQHKAELNAQGEEATAAFILDLEKDAKKAREEWAKVVKAREEYESSKKRMEKKAKEIDTLERPPVQPDVKTSEFQKKLSAVKDEPDYSAGDWFLLGFHAIKRAEFELAVTYYTNSIKLDKSRRASYNNRGFAFVKLGRYEEALKDCEKALEIDPEHVLALKNTAEFKVLLGQYDDALRLASRAVDLSEGSKDKATSLYLKCIAGKLSGKDTSATEAVFKRILKEDFVATFSFDVIERWLGKAKISEEEREFVKVKTAMLKTKKKEK